MTKNPVSPTAPQTPHPTGEFALVQQHGNFLQDIAQRTIALETLANQLEAMKKDAVALFKDYGVTSLSCGGCKFSFVVPHDSSRLDSKALEAAYPDLCAKYMKTAHIKESFRVTSKG